MKKTVKAYVVLAKTKPILVDSQVPTFWYKPVAERYSETHGGIVVPCTITYELPTN